LRSHEAEAGTMQQCEALTFFLIYMARLNRALIVGTNWLKGHHPSHHVICCLPAFLPPCAAGQRSDALTFANAYDDAEGLSVEVLTGPGFQAINVTLRGDPDAASSMPGGHLWPDPSMLKLPRASTSQPQWVMAVIAVCVTLAAVLLLLGGFLWWQRKRICMRDPEAGDMCMLDGSSDFSQAVSKANSQCHRHSPVNGAHQDRSCSADCSSIVDVGLHSGSSCAGAVAAGAGGKQGLFSGVGGGAPAADGAWQGAGAQSKQQGAGKGCDVSSQRDAAAGASRLEQPTTAAAVSAADNTSVSSSALADNVAAGMQRWRAAVSSTTMLLMERRMDAAAGSSTVDSNAANRSAANVSASCVSVAAGASRAARQQPRDSQQEQHPPPQQPDQRQSPGNGSGGSDGAGLSGQQMQLQELLGQGSFGSVFLAVWRGKRVAVKVMQLPASALLDPGEKLTTEHQPQPPGAAAQEPPGGEAAQQELSAQERRRRLQRKKQQNNPPHMAIMEAVVSSTMSHPNVGCCNGDVWVRANLVVMCRPWPAETGGSPRCLHLCYYFGWEGPAHPQ
jgi:hypothetical protein